MYHLFSFLYIRNWETGRHELSHLRVALFCAGLFLIMIAILIVVFHQAPVAYTS